MARNVFYGLSLSRSLFFLCIIVCISVLSGCNKPANAGLNAASNSTAEGKNFIEEVSFMYTVFACGKGTIPQEVSPAVVKRHCDLIKNKEKIYEKIFLNQFKPFTEKLRPANLPGVTVYPFGGSDLHTAFAAYPAARELITISLETAGDIRKVSASRGYVLVNALQYFSRALSTYLVTLENSNSNVMSLERGIVPGQLTLSLAAAAYYDYTPVSLKYFTFLDNGKLHYYSAEEIQQYAGKRAPSISRFIYRPPWEIPFINVEIVYRKPDGNTFIHRHISANLENNVFDKSGLKKYLESRGSVAAMTKGASYLPWHNTFSSIRNYLLNNMTFMLCDSTGILPRYAEQSGFSVTTYGTFHDAFEPVFKTKDSFMLRQYFKSQPYRNLPFQFGHSDVGKRKHMMVIKKK